MITDLKDAKMLVIISLYSLVFCQKQRSILSEALDSNTPLFSYSIDPSSIQIVSLILTLSLVWKFYPSQFEP